MIVSNSKGDSGAKRLDKIFAQNHPTPAKPQDQDYFFVKVNTSLKGTEMLGKQLKVESAIARVHRSAVECQEARKPGGHAGPSGNRARRVTPPRLLFQPRRRPQ